MALRKVVLAFTVVALCLGACSNSGEGKRAGATAAVQPTVSAPPAPTAPPVSVPPLKLKSPSPAGGEGARIIWPTLKTVGVPAGRKLKPSGPITVRKKGAVIDGLLVRTEINVVASNVTIRNTHLVGAGQWGIIQRKGASGLRVENSEING